MYGHTSSLSLLRPSFSSSFGFMGGDRFPKNLITPRGGGREDELARRTKPDKRDLLHGKNSSLHTTKCNFLFPK